MIDKLEGRTYLRTRGRWLGPVLIASFLGVFLLLTLGAPGLAGEVREGNAGREGSAMALQTLPVQGKVTLVDFFSPFCPPCMYLAPLLKQLAQKRRDLEIIELNINRPEVQGRIDWQSPLAQQLGLHSIPHFLIFGPQGRLTAQGPEARQQVVDWLREAGLIKQ
ncbi:MAG: thioredoxin family protein [Desulfobaccales bacterium]